MSRLRNGPQLRPYRGQTSKNFKFELIERLDHYLYSRLKFHEKSIGDSLDALKRCSDPYKNVCLQELENTREFS